MSSTAAALEAACRHANAGRFDAFRAGCWQIVEEAGRAPHTQLEVAALLSSFGFLSDARVLLEACRSMTPDDPAPLANLANLARDAGQHSEARQLYAALLTHLPNHPTVRRNVLTGLEYDPEVSDADRLAQARAWGEWATARAGGPRPRPAIVPLRDRPLGDNREQTTVLCCPAFL
ncbi:tetratricopeptide repeat protein [Thauera aromatica]|uniref:tetratricopeptide repeat protein n=1 Tax=Thauera aromatica TaxID=59405 RepID=UPI000D16BEBB|nr:tetratricopeptide repeat protein [Thauera aromatica]